MYHRVAYLSLALVLSASHASPILTQRTVSIPASLFDDFVLYTKYSSAAYQLVCPSPLGKTLIRSFETGPTPGFIALDTTREEIIVSFRGTFSLADAVTDAKVLLAPFVSPGVIELSNVTVHRGFLDAFNNVAEDVLAAVRTELEKFPAYKVVVTGHSLGGAIAALAAPSLKTALPKANVKLFTFGQPRVGNRQYAQYVEDLIGVDNIFRAVHTLDGVPTMVPRLWGYEHFATEYWQFRDPLPFTPTPPCTTVTKCVGGEDPACSDSIPSTGINPFHLVYFGQVMAVNPQLCS
ncbi:alpha/beta-hydrolase [Mycena pura]|uniref:Alpha/beta-hydrolase n=1 Tax=Mycena pura TaxID=153505 RepID=A0AAD6V9H9_9AGAR|nr:alpha/beta-hydrolase [Mycena pura]